MSRILVVDDNAGVLRLLKEVLTRGHTVFTAPGGEEALEIFRNEPVDLVITDIEMPGMTGEELLGAIREERPLFPVVAMSGSSEPEEVLQVGFDGFISKPFDIESVQEQVLEFLSRKRRVLIADDAFETRQTVRTVIEQLGFSGIEARNGAEALEILQRDGADLLICDCSMPLLSGRDLLYQAKAQFRDLKVVVVSAHFTMEDYHKLAPFAFLGKPFRLDELRRVVLDAMSQAT